MGATVSLPYQGDRQRTPPEGQVVAALPVPLEVDRDDLEAGPLDGGDHLVPVEQQELEAVDLQLDPGQVVTLVPDPHLPTEPEAQQRRLRSLDAPQGLVSHRRSEEHTSELQSRP